MNSLFIRLISALLAVLSVAVVPVFADYTNTAGDWMFRTEASFDDIGAEFYHILSEEAAKGADGWLGDTSHAESLSSILGEGAYGIKVYEYVGTTSFTADSDANVSDAAKDAVRKAVGNRATDVLAEISKIYAAFRNDHPECFWLNGYSLCHYTNNYSFSKDGTVDYTLSFYLVLTQTLEDGSVFDVRYDSYTDTDALRLDIEKRDEAISEILSLPEVTEAQTTAEKVTALTDALTRRNAYFSGENTPSSSHESLCALVGSTGANGPVCSGYARAFKVLCDNAGITCTVINGTSVNSLKKSGEHSWNAVMINGLWYAVDVTFSDPWSGTSDEAVSGFENRSYVLVGSDTVISGKRFSDTHFPDKRLTAEHSTLKAAPELYGSDYWSTPAEAYSTPFTDMDDRNIYYGEIKYAWDNRRMIGVSDTLFAPDVILTRAMIVTILWRREGSPEAALDTPFTDVPEDMWFTEAIEWAETEAIVKGYGDGTFGPYDTLTREQAIKILQRYAYYKGYDATVRTKYPSLSGYSYSEWAYSAAVFAKAFGLTDREQLLDRPARREEIAAYMERFDLAFGKGKD